MLVIDVRDSDFAGGHIRGAVNIGERPARSPQPRVRLTAGRLTNLQTTRSARASHAVAALPASPRPAAAETFCDDNRVDELVALCQGMDTVVLHCFLSQQRGPFCAQR